MGASLPCTAGHQAGRSFIEVDTSNVLIERLKNKELDLVIGRILQQNDGFSLSYEDVSEESHSVVARVKHPLIKRNDVGLKELIDAGWILSSTCTILRHQFDMVFRRAEINAPTNIGET